MKMHTYLLLGILGSSLLITACKQGNKQETTEAPTMENPFLSAYNTPFGVPPFDLIKNEHYVPAFEEGIKQQQAEIAAITSNTEAPTIENTLLALENSGLLLQQVSAVFYNLHDAHTNEEMDRIALEIAPKLSENQDNIYLNSVLFERIKQLWNSKSSLGLDAETERLLDQTYQSFVRGGAQLNETERNRLREINKELSSLTVQFGKNMLNETNAFKLIIDKEEELAGIPDALKQIAAEEATEAGHPGKWMFGLSNPSVMPFLQYASNREKRKEIWSAYSQRGNNGNENDNNSTLIAQANLRNEKARLLGYASHADYVLEESMAKTPQTVTNFLEKLWKPALKMANKEALALEKMLKAEYPTAKLEPWDWRYYEEKIRAKEYDFDENELKPYFELSKVRDGIFYTVERLYGLRFKQLENMPVYHEDVSVWEATKDGKHVGVMYMDFHPRESKRGGAWMTSFRDQYRTKKEDITPVVSIVCNFSKPGTNTPSLLTFDEVTTFFHEFGHAIHGLLSDVTYRSLSGTNVPRDFVELPSQILECWAAEPEVLKEYAKHYQTGEVLPASLLAKMENSQKFGQGFATTEYLAASLLDMDYHTQKENIAVDANAFEKASMTKYGLQSAIIPRYRSTYFSHIFAGGYSAGYYSYIWSELLDADAFAYFKEKGIFDRETADRFYTHVLSKGGTVDPAELYRRFRGKDPDVTPLMKRRGLM